MQLCLKGDDCETGVLGESVRMPLLFLQPFFPCLFPCIPRICHGERTCGYLVSIFSFLYLFFLPLLSPFDGIFDSILNFSAFY